MDFGEVQKFVMEKMDFGEVQKFVMEKLKVAWVAMGDFWGQFLAWFDKLFPPETRGEKIHHWFVVALPFLITGAVVIIFCKCCCSGRGLAVKMMKAPGRNCRMPRSVFESNPRSYFQNLRAYPGDNLC